MDKTADALKALIVDDEAPARSELRFVIEELDGVEVVGEATTAAEALQLIAAIPYDVVFLDIEMPGLSGLELAESLSRTERPPAVVFVTAYSQHAVKAFDVAAADYLVKPVEAARLKLTVERLRRGAAAGDAAQRLGTEARGEAEKAADGAGARSAGAAPRPGPPEEDAARVDRIPVDKSGRTLLIAGDEILFISAYDDYTYVHTAEGRYLSTLSMTALEQRLGALGFFRAHRSYLVNLSRVREVVPMYGGTLMLTLTDPDGTQIPVSRRRASALKRALGM
jgi:DNA-binding LytR/AlgR family response regulator